MLSIFQLAYELPRGWDGMVVVIAADTTRAMAVARAALDFVDEDDRDAVQFGAVVHIGTASEGEKERVVALESPVA